MPRELNGSVVYFIGAQGGPIKIGVARNVEARMRLFQTGSGARLELLATTPGSYTLEKHYHERFAKHRTHGEWFKRGADLMAEIKRLRTQTLPPHETAETLAERDRLRLEWTSAIERRNRLALANTPGAL